MGKDKYGNYLPTLPSPVLPGAPAIGIVTYGTGAPAFTPFPWQVFYVDTSSGNIYANNGGSWVAAGGGGGGLPQVLSGAGQPSANPGVTNAVYTDTNNGNLWKWYLGAWH